MADALVASRRLPDPTRCVLEASMSDVALPPRAHAAAVVEIAAEIERARVLAFAHDERARALAAAAVERALAVPYPPLAARAHMVHGIAESNYDGTSAAAPLARATELALEAGDEVLAVEAFARAAYVVGTGARDRLPAAVAEALAWRAPIEAVARGLGVAGAPARALLYQNLGKTMNAAGDRAAALKYFLLGRDEVRAAALTDVELEDLAFAIATLSETGAAREATLAASVERLRKALGAHHPMTLSTTYRAALFTHDPQRAAAALREACARSRASVPREDVVNHDCLYELGWLALERGDPGEARGAMEVVGGDQDRRGAVAVGIAAFADGDLRRAAAVLEPLGTDAGTAPWMHGYLADAAMVCGLAWQALGEPARATTCLERALALAEPFATTYPVGERRLARVRALLARALERDAPARAGELAAAAAAWYRDGDGYAEEVAALELLVARVTSAPR